MQCRASNASGIAGQPPAIRGCCVSVSVLYSHVTALEQSGESGNANQSRNNQRADGANLVQNRCLNRIRHIRLPCAVNPIG